MNTKIKLSILGILALIGFFSSVNNASAQYIVEDCDRATLNGWVNPNGNPTIAWFQWGTSSGNLNHSTPTNTYYTYQSYSYEITNLTQNTVYYYAAYFQNSVQGQWHSETISFQTPFCPVPPTVNLTATPTSIPYNTSSTLSWTTTNAVSCTASNAWTGTKGTSGSQSTGNLTSTKTYTLTCYNSAGASASDTVVVTVGAQVYAPTVNLTATPTSIPYNTSSTLSWTTTNAVSCTASNAWTGTKGTSGSQSTGNLTSTKTYTLTCYNSAGASASDTVVVTVGAQVYAPTVNLTATPTSIPYNTSSTLSWTTTNAVSCTASNAWTGTKGTSGSQSTGNLTSTKTYTLTCYNSAGASASDTVIVTVGAQIYPPTVNLIATPPSVIYGGSSTLSWTTTNATTCIASIGVNGWAGPKATSGSFYSGILTNTTNYVLTCSGAGGTTSDIVTIIVGQALTPTVDLTANPTSITLGASTLLAWNSTNATSCSATWTTSTTTSGTKILYPTATTTYYITCYGAGGNHATDSVTVTVGIPPVMSGDLNLIPTSCIISSGNSGCDVYISWNTINPQGTSVITSSYPIPGSIIFTANSGYQSVFIPFSSRTFFLYNSGILLDQGTATASCASGTSWDGSKCIPPPPQYPTVDLSANPAFVSYGGSSTLSWTSTNATSCNATGGTSGWAGYKATSGTFYTGALTYTVTYTINSTNSSGSATDSVTVVVDNQQILIPTVDLTANPTSVSYGGSSTLTWTTTNATSCNATGGTSGWAGPKNISYGSFYTGPLTYTVTFTLTCTGDGGSATDSVTVYVDNQQILIPTVDLTANPTYVIYNGASTLSWYSTNTTSCNATGGTSGWAGYKATSGTFYTGALTYTATFTLTCTGTGGSATDSVTVYVDNQTSINPDIETNSATNIEEESATLNGFVDSNGGSNTEAWFEWGTDTDYDYDTNHVNYGSTGGTYFDYDLDGLDSDETYYFRAVAENNEGQRFYGSQKNFTTDEDGNNNNNDDEPDVNTYSATDVESDRATLNGYVDTNGESTSRWFEWGTSSNSLNYETDESSNSTSSRNFEETIDNLNPDTTYYFRAVAENDNGTDYGNILSFRTDDDNENNVCDYGICAPTAITTLATNIGQTSARLNGLGLVNDNVYTTGYFEWGTTQGLGNTTINKSIGNTQSNPYYESLFSLASGITYYYRAVVTNQYGTSVGDIVSFRTNQTIYIDNNTNTNTNTVYRNTTVVTNTNTVGNSRPSLVFLSVSRNDETIRRGEIVEYVVNYKNVSSRNLRDVILQISLPKELQFMETSRGYFSTENNTVVVNIGNLNAQEEGSVRVTVKVITNAEINKIVVVTANLAYTIIDDNTQEEVFAYSKNTVAEGGTVQLGALAFLFGNGFLPNSLLGWLLLILLIILIILAVRKAYYSSGRTIKTETITNHN